MSEAQVRPASDPSAAVVAAILDGYGQTYASEAGFDVSTGKPAVLFELLVLSLLLSARIAASQAVRAARGLFDAGWTTPEKMAGSTWRERTDVLNACGYARYDESTSRMVGDTTELLLAEYRGDLRRLRDRSDGDVAEARRRLERFRGIGPVGADIFLREVQGAWTAFYPFADERVLRSAERLGLPATVKALAATTSRQDFPRLVAGLVRVDLARDHQRVLDLAAGRAPGAGPG
jgi:endonuclease III